jgi:hypothetical protein
VPVVNANRQEIGDTRAAFPGHVTAGYPEATFTSGTDMLARFVRPTHTVAALAAAALIVPQHGIHGVNLSMSRRAVTSRLGPPLRVETVTASPTPEQLLIFRHYRVWFAPGVNVVQIETTSTADRTATGVGVGSNEAQVRAGVKGVRCATESAIRHCHLGVYAGGRVVTDFFFRRGRVNRIVIGRVLD